MSFTKEIQSGDLCRALTAQRDHLALLLTRVEPDKGAALHARLTDVLVRLDAISAPKESTLDDLAAARKKRRSTA